MNNEVEEFMEVVKFHDPQPDNPSRGSAVTKDDGVNERLDLKLLCREFHSMYVQDLLDVSKPFDELTRSQHVLLESMQQENERIVEIGSTFSLEETFSKVIQYQTKLVSIKKEMVALHDKVVKLKKRAFHVQQVKEKQRISAQRS